MNAPLSEFSLPFGPEMLWFVFLAILATFGVYSLFLIYHWFRYGMSPVISLIAAGVYFSVSCIILIVMFYSVILLS